jgi:hypothetical protein
MFKIESAFEANYSSSYLHWVVDIFGVCSPYIPSPQIVLVCLKGVVFRDWAPLWPETTTREMADFQK